MTTLAVALRHEIRRLARKEVKAQTAVTAQAVRQYRRDIARLKRQLRDQETQLKALTAVYTTRPEVAEAISGHRFSARSAKAQRRRTGLSAADYAVLVGVSPLTIYNWEHGKSRPQKKQFETLVALRGLGRRQALARLKQLKADRKPISRPR